MARRGLALFVVNPVLPHTGQGFAGKVLGLARKLGWEGTALLTEPGSNVEAIGAALARDHFDMVVAAGGDGTVAEVMAAAYPRNIPVGIVSRGTANIVARELGLPATWHRGVRRILQRFPHTRAIDLARVNGGYAALAAGIGFDASVMRYTPRVLKSWMGRPAYLLAGAWWLPRAPLFTASIRADGEHLITEAVAVLVVNAGMLGAAPFRFAPNIAIDDGWLDLCVYRPRTAAERWRVLMSLLTRRLDGSPVIWQRKVRSVEIKAPDREWHEVDGEVSRGNVLKAEVIPRGVRIVV
jgi:diacylglycerol kinase family enzyme